MEEKQEKLEALFQFLIYERQNILRKCKENKNDLGGITKKLVDNSM